MGLRHECFGISASLMARLFRDFRFAQIPKQRFMMEDKMSFSVRFRLSAMMFLEYAIWGAWVVVLGAYLGSPPQGGNPQLYLGFEPLQVGAIFSLLPLATIIAPFIFGQLADRLVSSQYLLAICHIVGGVLLFAVGKQHQYGLFMWLMFAYSLVYAPTLALTNSLAFSHMKDSEREFGGIRVWGTLGWIAAGWVLWAWRSWLPAVSGDMLFLAAGFSVLLGLLSLSLPNTPPKKEGTSPLAFLEALKLFKSPSFTVFMIISFIVGTELEFYYILTSPFMEHIGWARASVPAVMTIAQIAEILVMAVMLPRLLPKLGARKMLSIGVIAWPIRYAIFAFLPIKLVVAASLLLHGFCYVFFFVVGFIYVDRIAPKDIRASAQALVAIVVLGAGRFLGSRFAGWIQEHFTSGGQTNWQYVFLVPCVLTIVCALAFLLFFREEKAEAEPVTA
jgi:nucleoside transporter